MYLSSIVAGWSQESRQACPFLIISILLICSICASAETTFIVLYRFLLPGPAKSPTQTAYESTRFAPEIDFWSAIAFAFIDIPLAVAIINAA